MRVAFRISLLAIGLASLLGAGAASAGALVEFPNTSEHAPKLLGYLARPDTGLSAELDESRPYGGGPFPAVVVLHSCIGMTGHFTGIADRLSSWGYVALAVDSFGPSGITDRCGVGAAISRSMPTRRCATCRSWISSIRPGWPFSANRWAANRRSLLSRETWLGNISQNGFAPRSPITPTASSRHQA
jgi:hypothetical protein